jgi:hypothetical protein
VACVQLPTIVPMVPEILESFILPPRHKRFADLNTEVLNYADENSHF